MACLVFRNQKTNQIEKVLAPNEQPSQLYQQILKSIPNPEEAIQKWAELHVNPPTNIRDINGEPVYFAPNKKAVQFFADVEEDETTVLGRLKQKASDISISEDESVYTMGRQIFKRITNFIKELKGVDTTEEWYVAKARRMFKGMDTETKLKTEEGELTESEYVKVLQEADVKGRMRGNIIHTIIQMALHPKRLGELQQQLETYMLEGGFNEYQFRWVENKIEHILAKTGSNIFDALDDETQRDKVESELTVASDLLGLAGTIDLLIQHADGSLSITDFKTGYNFNKLTPSILKYGRSALRSITTSQRDVAKLQIALYAFMIKLQEPSAKFRHLQVMWIPNENSLKHFDYQKDVDLINYLNLIETWLKTDPQMAKAWAEIQQLPHFNSLFNASTYLQHYTPEVVEDMAMEGLEGQAQVHMYLQQLRALVSYDVGNTDDDVWMKAKRKQAAALVQKVLKLMGDTDIDYQALGAEYDISWLSSIFGSFQDQTSPYIQVINRLYEERKQIAEKRYDMAYKGLLARLTPIYQEYQRNRGIAVLEKIPIVKGQLNFTNYKDLYDPLYKQIKLGSKTKWVFRSTDADWAELQNDSRYNLTDEQIKLYRNLADYMMDQYAQFFEDKRSNYIDPTTKQPTALWNRIAAYKDIRGVDTLVTEGELYNGIKDGYNFRPNSAKSPFKYVREELIPMIPKTAEEIRSTDGVLSAKHAEHLKNHYGKMYYEEYFEQWYNDEMILPFKYLPNEKVMNQENFSLNAEMQFDRFMRAMIFKEELDDVYALGKSIQWSLQLKTDSDLKPMFKNTTNFLDDMLEMVIRGRTQRSFEGKMFGRGLNRDWVKIIKTFKQFWAAPIMWLKPIQGTANGVFTYIYTVKEGIKGSIIQRRLFGLDNSVVDFTTSDLAWATGMYLDMQKDAMLGNLRTNKMFLLLKRLNYLPDNYKWATESSDLLTARNKLFSQSTMYMFHTIPEEAVTAMIMAAQLKNMRISKNHPDKDVADKSVWDMYHVVEKTNEDGTTYHDVQWGKKNSNGTITNVVRGYVNLSKDPAKPVMEELGEINSREAQTLKFVYHRMHGGYRPDERIRLEYYVFGELFMQFKKFLPTILKNAMQSKGRQDSLGYYKPTGELKDGVEVMEWSARLVEGRWRVFLKTIAAYLSIRQKYDNPTNSYHRVMNFISSSKYEDYKWEKLSPDQKAAFVDAVTSLLIWGMLAGGYHMIFGTAGDDDSWKKLYSRIMNDYSQQYNWRELLKNIAQNTAPVSGRKMFKATSAFADFTLSFALYHATGNEQRLTARGDYEGLAELLRSLPFLSSYKDIYMFLENDSSLDMKDYIFTKSIN